MELVKGYSSDDSENSPDKEAKKTSSPKSAVNIATDDENDPIEIICVKSKEMETKTPAPERVVECIDLSDSDTEETVPNSDKLEKLTPTVQPQEKLTPTVQPQEEIDFLHLVDSDTDDEQISVQKSVNDLLSSSAILNDITCGPIKPEISSTAASPDSNIRSTPSPAVETLMDVSEIPFVSSERKSESPVPRKVSKTNEESLDVKNGLPSDPQMFMYRTDERLKKAKHQICRVPKFVSQIYPAHNNVVTALNWCESQYNHLFLTASADCTLKIWDMFSKNPVQCIKNSLGFKAAEWLSGGEQVIAGGFDKKAHVYDILSGKEVVAYDIFNYVTSIEVHPYMEDVFLCGTSNAILGFDLRVNTNLPIRTFLSKCDEVLDVAFSDENEFICSTSVVSRDSANRTIMVWDFASGAILSNQIFLERFTCPSVKVHPHNSSFVAQTNGDYIASFSTARPYKIMSKRYMSHKVSGYGIECDISPDGKYLASGDATGSVYIYNYMSASLIQSISVKSGVATNRLKWHPVLPSTMATTTWDGQVHILK